jgi:hypothetical protein
LLIVDEEQKFELMCDKLKTIAANVDTDIDRHANTQNFAVLFDGGT